MSSDEDRRDDASADADQRKSGNLATRPKRQRAIAEGRRGGRDVARKPGLLPEERAPLDPPSEPVPFSWVGPVQPAQAWLDLRRTRRRRFFLRLAIFSGLPTLFTLFYMLFVASPRYVSEFQITYQSYQPTQALSSGLVQNLLGTSSSSSVDLSAIIDQFIGSQSLMAKLDQELHLRKYYSSPKVDYLSRMNPNAPISTFLRYYNWYVSVSQGIGGYLTVDVQAFDPDYAFAVAKAIVKATDKMVDQMTARAGQDQVRYAQEEVNRAEDRVRKSRVALTEFQNDHGDLNPPGSASQLGGIVGTLEDRLATARTTLTTLASASPHSPQIVTVKYQIAALEEQLKQEKNRLANSSGGTLYSKLLEQYSTLQTRTRFRQDRLSGRAARALGRARRRGASAKLSDRFRAAIPARHAEPRICAVLYIYRADQLAGAVRHRQPYRRRDARSGGDVIVSRSAVRVRSRIIVRKPGEGA